jgi:16S rRNA (cytidine1402-2'-O)-methyltransferase
MSATPESKRRASGAIDPRTGHLAPGALDSGLYLVATPIGNAADITLRALDVLARADAIAAEDTRQTRKLMEMHGVALAGRPMISYNDRNGAERRPRILAWLREGMSVAYCSDAGTPLIADPGYRLAEMAVAEELGLTAIPGASAVLTALSLAGLPTDRFLFAGFLPPKRGARKKALGELATVPATLVFYESPRRVADALAAQYAIEDAPRGEVVILVGPPDVAVAHAKNAASLDGALAEALFTLSVKDAARSVATRLDLPRRDVYARALELAKS